MSDSQKNIAPYGYCPICSAEGISRERRLNGYDKCKNGHVYKSMFAINFHVMRENFEKWIKSPPYEHHCKHEKTTWPGQYDQYETQLAWEAWQAATAYGRQRG